MPIRVRHDGKMWRLVTNEGRLETGQDGKPIDGGGFATEIEAIMQARAINKGD